jgi:hypothetical protein
VLAVLTERDRSLAATRPSPAAPPTTLPGVCPGSESSQFTRVVVHVDPLAREGDDTDRIVGG